MVIINQNTLKQKVDNFIQENHITHLIKDPTDNYQKQIQQAIQKCNALVDIHTHKYLINIKPMAPKLNVYIQTRKENEPIRSVINNTQAPSYKTAKYLYKKLHNLVNLPYTYTTKNSQEVAEELKRIQINESMKIITFDFPVQGIIQPTKFWLNKHNNTNTVIEQTLHLLKTILKQNYFQYSDHLFQPKKGIAMGSPISCTVAEIYLQFLEETHTV